MLFSCVCVGVKYWVCERNDIEMKPVCVFVCEMWECFTEKWEWFCVC